MVNLAYDVKRQCGRDKTLNYYIGDYARDVIKAKDEKVYDEFIYLAKQLEEEGWEQFIDWSKNLINEYNQIIESKKPSSKSIKSLKESHHLWRKLSGANEENAIQILDQIQNYFKNEYLNIKITDFDYTNKTINNNAITWWYECDGESLKYIDVDILKAYVQLAFRFEIDLNVFINKNKIYITISEDEWN